MTESYPLEPAVVQTDPADLAFLAEQAAEHGLKDPPPVRRIDDGAGVSALLWGDTPAQLVFLHGAGLNAHTFDDTLLALAAGANAASPTGGVRLPSALAVDLPGHGHSAWRSDLDYRPSVLAGALDRLLDQYAAAPAVFVGHSLGGLVAVEWAVRRPERVRAIALVDITPDVGTGDAQQVRDFLAHPTDFSSRDEIVKRAAAFGFGGSCRGLERGVALNTVRRADGRVVFRHHLANLGLDQALAANPSGAQWPATEAIGSSAEMLLIRAESGFVSSQAAADFAHRVPSATVVTVPTGHNVQEQNASLLAELIAPLLG